MSEREHWSDIASGVRGAAVWVGRSVSSAYHAIDPDARRHLVDLPLIGATMLSPRRRAIAALADDGHPPVVLVHGLGGHPGNFLPLRAWMRLVGRSRTYAIGLPDDESIEQLAERLGALLLEVAERNALPEGATLDVVAHSMGGLVARCALEDPVVAARIGRLVTLGTPHGGTHAARFGASARLIALRPGSPTLERLRGQLPWPGPPRLPPLTSFWSRADLMLLPAESACVEGADNRELPGVSHYGYLIRPATWRAVAAALA